MNEMLKDARFAHIAKDPKFRRIPRAERKVKIDKRFEGMFKDKKFTVRYTVDKRGRPINETTTENLRKYYDLSSSEDENVVDEEVSVPSTSKNIDTGEEAKTIKKKRTAKEVESSSAKNSLDKESKDEQNDDDCFSSNREALRIKSKEKLGQSHDDKSDNVSFVSDENIQEGSSASDSGENDEQLHERRKDESNELTKEVKEKLKDLNVNYARGEGVLFTDSSSSEEELSEASDAEEESIEHYWGELDKEAETTDEITHRLAICNMDWDRIRAVDLMILLNSFLPNGGLIRSVIIYPSEFGQQRMKEEEMYGPTELRSGNINSENENENDDEENERCHMEKLRKYQLNRLKYYYAVAEFDSVETANKVYTECDGIEYESTANKLDLRFIPDDMTFDQEPTEICNGLPELTKYQPRQFATAALQQVKVNLTWDETNPDRQEFTQKLNSGRLQDIDEHDLQTYLASGSEDDSDVEEKKNITNKTTNNLEPATNNDTIGKYKSLLKTIEEEEETKKKKDVELEFTWGIGTKEKIEKLVKEKTKNDTELTPFEQYVEKRKAKRKAKREEKMKLKEQSRESDSEDSVPSDIDMSDKYFAEEFKSSKALCRKKKKRVNEDNNVDSSNEQEENRRAAELELLLMDQDEDDGKKHFNMKEIEQNATLSKSKRKRLSKRKKMEDETKEDDFEVDVKDSRFAALFTSHNFNIDPADPHYRKTKGTEALVNEKLKRRANNEVHIEDESDKQSKKTKMHKELSTELQVLVKSVKKKAQNVTRPIRR